MQITGLTITFFHLYCQGASINLNGTSFSDHNSYEYVQDVLLVIFVTVLCSSTKNTAQHHVALSWYQASPSQYILQINTSLGKANNKTNSQNGTKVLQLVYKSRQFNHGWSCMNTIIHKIGSIKWKIPCRGVKYANVNLIDVLNSQNSALNSAGVCGSDTALDSAAVGESDKHTKKIAHIISCAIEFIHLSLSTIMISNVCQAICIQCITWYVLYQLAHTIQWWLRNLLHTIQQTLYYTIIHYGIIVLSCYLCIKLLACCYTQNFNPWSTNSCCCTKYWCADT